MVRNALVILVSLIFSLINITSYAGIGGSEKFKAIGPKNIICTGSLVTLTSNGGNAEEYLWYPTKYFTNNTLKTVSTTIRETTTFMVVKIDVHTNKKDTANITIKVKEENFEVLGENYVCAGDSTYLILPPAYQNPIWSTGETSRGIWVKKAGVYYVSGQGNCNIGKGAIHVKSLSKPLALITTFGSLELCKGQKVKLGAFGQIFRYEWSTGEVSREIEVNETKEIELIVYNECGIAKDVKQVTVQEVEASFIPSKTKGNVPFTLKLINESHTFASNKWFVNGVEFSQEENPTLLIEKEGKYEIELIRTSKNGCENKMKYSSIVAQAPIKKVAPDKLIVVPNSFTPNGDGINDEFGFQSNFIFDIKFVVFDRWGREIYESTGNGVGWDGRIGNGDLAPIGKYIVVYEFIDLDNKAVSKTMELNLLR